MKPWRKMKNQSPVNLRFGSFTRAGDARANLLKTGLERSRFESGGRLRVGAERAVVALR